MNANANATTTQMEGGRATPHRVPAILYALLAMALVVAVPLASWALADSDTCGYAYLDPIADADGAYKLVLQAEPRTEEGVYVDLGSVKAGGYADEDEVLASPPWAESGHVGEIREFEVRGAVRPNSMAYWFDGCDSLREADLSQLDGSSLTDVSGLFAGCYALENVTFGTLDVTHATSFGNLFEGCTSLSHVDLSQQATPSARSMARMFAGCESLVTCSIPRFDVSKVTDASGMFEDCTSLASVDLSSFGTSRVEDLSCMFSGCSKLTRVEMPSFATPNLADATDLFLDCASLEHLDLSALDASAASGSMFVGCDAVNSITIGPDFGSASALEGLFGIDAAWYPADGDGAGGAGGDSGGASGDGAGGDSASGSAGGGSVSGGDPAVDSSAPCTTAQQMIAYVQAKGAPVTFTGQPATFNIYAIENVQTHTLIVREGERALAEGESALGAVKSGSVPWDSRRLALEAVVFETTVAPSSVAAWFKDCASLEHVEGLSNLDVSKAGDLSYLFSGCAALSTLDLAALDVSRATNLSHMLEGCTSLVSLTLPTTASPQVTDLSHMLRECSSLRTVSLSGLGASRATDLSHLFQDCASLESVDLAGLDTSSVTSMGSLFAGCAALDVASIDFAGLDTAAVRDFSGMFMGCASLAHFDLSVLDLSRAANVASMFAECRSLAEFTFGTVNLSSPSLTCVNMFGGCDRLSTVHVGKSSRLGMNAYPTFPSGSWLSSADGNVYDQHDIPSRVEATYTLVNVTADTRYALLKETGEFTVGTGEPPSGEGRVFVYDSAGYENPDDVPWHLWRAHITSVRIGASAGGSATSDAGAGVASVANWFSGCTNLASADISGLGGGSSISVNFSDSFSGCTALREVRLPHDVMVFDAASMFAGCTALASVDLSGMQWNSGGATSMFEGCTRLANVQVGDSLGGSSTVRMFAGCTALPAIDLSGVRYLGDATEMFDGCTSLASVSLGSVSVRTGLAGMFRGCTALRDVDTSGLSVVAVTDFSEMFRNCTALRSIDVSGLDTRAATSMRRMFHGCRALESVTLGESFTFRGSAFARLPGSELPSGAWQAVGAEGTPIDATRAYASDSLPNFVRGTYAKVDAATPGLTVESVRGDSADGSAKYTIASTMVEAADGTLEEQLAYTLDDAYSADTFTVGDSAKSSAWAQVGSSKVKRSAVARVSAPKSVTGIVLGPQVERVMPFAFADAPSITTVKVESRHLTTQKSMRNCFARSHVVKVYVEVESRWLDAVMYAFTNWAGRRAL